jgi:hypothetical protein
VDSLMSEKRTVTTLRASASAEPMHGIFAEPRQP